MLAASATPCGTLTPGGNCGCCCCGCGCCCRGGGGALLTGTGGCCCTCCGNGDSTGSCCTGTLTLLSVVCVLPFAGGCGGSLGRYARYSSQWSAPFNHEGKTYVPLHWVTGTLVAATKQDLQVIVQYSIPIQAIFAHRRTFPRFRCSCRSTTRARDSVRKRWRFLARIKRPIRLMRYRRRRQHWTRH